MLDNRTLATGEDRPVAPSMAAAPRSRASRRTPPHLIVHVVHRFSTGGLENGLVNLINRLPAERYRHAIVAITDYSDFSRRLERKDVEIVALNKPAGRNYGYQVALWRILRRWRPAIVHTRNTGTLDCVGAALLAGVPVRVHGLHGWDMENLAGPSRRDVWLYRLFAPWVQRFVAVSRDLAHYAEASLGVREERLTHLCNGVDTARYVPRAHAAQLLKLPPHFRGERALVIGTVGRMEAVKNTTAAAGAFVSLLARRPDLRGRLRLVCIGDGPLRGDVERLLRERGAADLAWLPGERSDVAELLRELSLFVLPSLNEGISNTLLEAMASGLPCIATDVGGNREIVANGATGELVAPNDAEALARAIERYADAPDRLASHGAAARRRAEEKFSIDAMVSGYRQLYEGLLAGAGFQ